MYAQVEKPKENKSRAVADSVVQKKNSVRRGFGLVGNKMKNKQHFPVNNIIKRAGFVQRKRIQMPDNKVLDSYTKTAGELEEMMLELNADLYPSVIINIQKALDQNETKEISGGTKQHEQTIIKKEQLDKEQNEIGTIVNNFLKGNKKILLLGENHAETQRNITAIAATAQGQAHLMLEQIGIMNTERQNMFTEIDNYTSIRISEYVGLYRALSNKEYSTLIDVKDISNDKEEKKKRRKEELKNDKAHITGIWMNNAIHELGAKNPVTTKDEKFIKFFKEKKLKNKEDILKMIEDVLGQFMTTLPKNDKIRDELAGAMSRGGSQYEAINEGNSTKESSPFRSANMAVRIVEDGVKKGGNKIIALVGKNHVAEIVGSLKSMYGLSDVDVDMADISNI